MKWVMTERHQDDWHKWFAWYPVTVGFYKDDRKRYYEYAWLTWVLKKTDYSGYPTSVPWRKRDSEFKRIGDMIY